MKPLPETRQALDEFDSFESPELEDLLDNLGAAAGRIVPELTGLSLALAGEQLTFTLIASDSEIASLDAAQYLNGGPCVDVGLGNSAVEQYSAGDAMDEERWHRFAAATAAQGVASTLSLPVYAKGRLVGSVNLYAATPDAFEGRVQRLADLVGATPTAAIANADLSFSTRLEAAAAPQRLRDQAIIDTALGLIAADRGIDIERARQHLIEAAARAGTELVEVARVLIAVYNA
jgi:GAF domain-containing protein